MLTNRTQMSFQLLNSIKSEHHVILFDFHSYYVQRIYQSKFSKRKIDLITKKINHGQTLCRKNLFAGVEFMKLLGSLQSSIHCRYNCYCQYIPTKSLLPPTKKKKENYDSEDQTKFTDNIKLGKISEVYWYSPYLSKSFQSPCLLQAIIRKVSKEETNPTPRVAKEPLFRRSSFFHRRTMFPIPPPPPPPVGATAAGGGGTGCCVAFCSLELSGFIIVFLDSFFLRTE